MGRKAKGGISQLKGIYRVYCGRYRRADGKVGGSMFYLGADETAARFKRDILRAEWRKAEAEGHKVWPEDAIHRLADQHIIGTQSAKARQQGHLTQTVRTVVQTPDAARAELAKYRDEDGAVAFDGFPFYVATLFKQELTEPELEAHMRKALRKHGFERPMEAMKLAMEFWKMCREQGPQPQTQVNVNVGGSPIAVDESEKRALKIARIVEGGAGGDQGESTDTGG